MPVNLGLVIDRSGSMHGDKIEKAKQAALVVVDSLGDQDYLSIVTYDDEVDVLVPATRVTDRESLRRTIMGIFDDGGTALHAGVTAGIQQVRERFDKQRVNRIILLSDGIANVGPSSPQELAQLGVHAGSLGIPITTIGLGLGYNEDLMTQLALASDGNHAFAEDGSDLYTIFQHELGDVLSVVAQDIVIEIEFEPGIKPLRGVNRPLSIRGRKASLKLNQIYGKQTKKVLVEVAVPRGEAGEQRKLADVGVRYRNLRTAKLRKVNDALSVAFSDSKKRVEREANSEVMVSVVEALANERQQKAIALRDMCEVDKSFDVMYEKYL
jgi:Ca-activated chloride channel family protein